MVPACCIRRGMVLGGSDDYQNKKMRRVDLSPTVLTVLQREREILNYLISQDIPKCLLTNCRPTFLDLLHGMVLGDFHEPSIVCRVDARNVRYYDRVKSVQLT